MTKPSAFVLLVLTSACASTSSLQWRELPTLSTFDGPDEVLAELPTIYDQSRFGTLIVVANVVYGNPCTNHRISSTGVGGATAATGVSGTTSSTGIAGTTSSTGVAGATSSTGVAGATGGTGVAGTAASTGVTGATSSTGVAGATGTAGVSGSTRKPQCASTSDPEDYIIRLLAPSLVQEFDGKELRPLPAARVRR